MKYNIHLSKVAQTDWFLREAELLHPSEIIYSDLNDKPVLCSLFRAYDGGLEPLLKNKNTSDVSKIKS